MGKLWDRILRWEIRQDADFYDETGRPTPKALESVGALRWTFAFMGLVAAAFSAGDLVGINPGLPKPWSILEWIALVGGIAGGSFCALGRRYFIAWLEWEGRWRIRKLAELEARS